jgi:hypothetical protein
VKTFRIAALVLFLTAAGLCGDKGFNPPPAGPATSYPAHEAHDDEKTVIAVDPFTTPEKAAVFKVHYRDYGFLPVRIIIANDGDKPLMLDNIKIELVTGNKEKVRIATRDDIFRRLARPEKITAKSKIQLPIPLPRDRNAISKDARDEIDAANLGTYPVMPHSSRNGFVFFDVAGISDPQTGAHVQISGIKSGSQELFYFDIPLQAYVNQPSK